MGEMDDLRVSGGKINGADVVDGAVDRLIVKSLGASTDPSGPGSVSSAHVGLRDRARRAMEGLGGASGPLPWSSHDGRAAFWFTEGDRQDLRTEVFNASVRTATRMRRFVVSASSAVGMSRERLASDHYFLVLDRDDALTADQLRHVLSVGSGVVILDRGFLVLSPCRDRAFSLIPLLVDGGGLPGSAPEDPSVPLVRAAHDLFREVDRSRQLSARLDRTHFGLGAEGFGRFCASLETGDLRPGDVSGSPARSPSPNGGFR